MDAEDAEEDERGGEWRADKAGAGTERVFVNGFDEIDDEETDEEDEDDREDVDEGDEDKDERVCGVRKVETASA